MISYTMVGTKDIAKAGEFFDKVLGVVGAIRSMDHENFILWSIAKDQPSFSVCIPHDGNEACVGNGVMISFTAVSKEIVDEMHKVALENGGIDEGAPGERMPGYYMAYFRDLDGNKFAAFHATGEAA